MVEHIARKKVGLCHAFQLNCSPCGKSIEFKSSKEVRKSGSGMNSYNVSDRSMRFAGMKRFCGIMNIMPPLNRTTYSDKMTKLNDAYHVHMSKKHEKGCPRK